MTTRFASEGMRLLNFNVEAQCTPSRACLLTGRYAVPVVESEDDSEPSAGEDAEKS